MILVIVVASLTRLNCFHIPVMSEAVGMEMFKSTELGTTTSCNFNNFSISKVNYCLWKSDKLQQNIQKLS